MDCLDKSLTNLRHQTKKRKIIIKSNCCKVIIVLCIMFSFVVTIGFIIKTGIKSNNESWNEERKKDTQQRLHKNGKYKYKDLVLNNCTYICNLGFYLNTFT